jgi:hypothetical protein
MDSIATVPSYRYRRDVWSERGDRRGKAGLFQAERTILAEGNSLRMQTMHNIVMKYAVYRSLTGKHHLAEKYRRDWHKVDIKVEVLTYA